MLTINVLKTFLEEAILNTILLINRMPTWVLRDKTPLEVFQSVYPKNRLITNLPLSIFRCASFVHIHFHNWREFDPRVFKCVFLVYSPTKKGYKCFDKKKKKKLRCLLVLMFRSLRISLTSPKNHFWGRIWLLKQVSWISGIHFQSLKVPHPPLLLL